MTFVLLRPVRWLLIRLRRAASSGLSPEEIEENQRRIAEMLAEERRRDAMVCEVLEFRGDVYDALLGVGSIETLEPELFPIAGPTTITAGVELKVRTSGTNIMEALDVVVHRLRDDEKVARHWIAERGHDYINAASLETIVDTISANAYESHIFVLPHSTSTLGTIHKGLDESVDEVEHTIMIVCFPRGSW